MKYSNIITKVTFIIVLITIVYILLKNNIITPYHSQHEVDVLTSLKTELEKILNDVINHFILKHAYTKPCARMLILIIENRSVSEFHMKNINDIDEKGITKEKAIDMCMEHGIYEPRSKEVTKQSNCDFVQELKDDLVVAVMDNLTFDAKLKTNPLTSLALTKGLISLSLPLSEKDKILLIKRTIADLGYVLKGLSQKPQTAEIINEILALKSYHDSLNNTCLDKNLTIEAKYIKLKQIRDLIDLDPNIRTIVATRIEEMVWDNYFDKIFSKNIDNNIDFTLVINKIDLKDLIPYKKQTINTSAWDNAIEVIKEEVKSVMPEEIKEMMDHNYYKFKMLEYIP